MLIDSHCHLNMIDLSLFEHKLDNVLATAKAAGVEHFLSVCVDIEEFPQLCAITDSHPEVSISIGSHPANPFNGQEPSIADLEAKARHPRCIAIGETGLDYYHVKDHDNQEQQRQRFATHIQAAISAQKPLIIHMRDAAEDTIKIMKNEKADLIGGVMHCFSENLDIARKAMDLNFYISISGIITFKNAQNLRDLVKEIPLDRLLIETDSPFLAPDPFRGKPNHPALVKYIALAIAAVKKISVEEIGRVTTENFKNCFKVQV